MYEKLRKDISEYCESEKRQVNIETLTGGVPLDKDTSGKIDRMRDSVNTYLVNNEIDQAIKLLDQYRRDKKDQNTTFKAVCDGIHTALSKEAGKDKTVIRDLQGLKETVAELKTQINSHLRDAEQNFFTKKEETALRKLVSSTEAIVEKHQNNQFATSATVSEARKELKSQLNKFQNKVARESYFAKVGEYGAAIKASLQNTLSKITVLGIPPVVKVRVTDKSTTLGFMEAGVKNAKNSIAPKSGKR